VPSTPGRLSRALARATVVETVAVSRRRCRRLARRSASKACFRSRCGGHRRNSRCRVGGSAAPGPERDRSPPDVGAPRFRSDSRFGGGRLGANPRGASLHRSSRRVVPSSRDGIRPVPARHGRHLPSRFHARRTVAGRHRRGRGRVRQLLRGTHVGRVPSRLGDAGRVPRRGSRRRVPAADPDPLLAARTPRRHGVHDARGVHRRSSAAGDRSLGTRLHPAHVILRLRRSRESWRRASSKIVANG
jgi:hypothetical protein